MKRCVAVATALSVSVVVPALAGGPTVVDLVSSMDNTLYEEPQGALSNGAGSRLFVGVTGQEINNRRRGLVAFDLQGVVPAGATITGATLTMTMVRAANFDNVDVGLHRVLRQWGEAGSVAPGGQGAGANAALGDATWIHSEFDTASWTTPGGDFDPVASATAGVGGLGAVMWSSVSLISDVQAWVDDPSSNYGWLLLADEASGVNAKAFATKEDFSASVRPTLTVTYIPSPGAVALGALFGCHALTRRRRARRAVS